MAAILKRISCLLLLGLLLALLPLSAAAQEAQEAPTGISLPILMYHHISCTASACGDYTVSPETLEGDLRYLHERGYQTISLHELLAFVHGEGTLPPKPVMLTFDDGQESFASYALPLFEKYDMCAVLAIIGSVADAYTKTEDHNIAYSYFSWPALAELAQSRHVELAVHTHDLHKLKGRDGCRIRPGEDPATYLQIMGNDLSLVEQRFVEHLGSIPPCFAYPYGYYCKEARALLSERGYDILFTCNPTVNQLTGNPEELLSLGRFNRPNGMERARYFQRLGI